MSFDPYAPYGPVVTSTVRVVTWNVWGRCGADWAARLGLPYHQFTGDWRQEDWVSGIGLVSRWPMTEPQCRPLRAADGAGSGQAVHVTVAGERGPIHTWSNRNPLAALGLYPDRRFDYILSAWPRRGGAGHPVRCSLLGVRGPGEQQVSDHYGLAADLRY
ncbi:MAG: hypothetical protein ACRDOU_24475 [Streptosporangiaceae bacterium]